MAQETDSPSVLNLDKPARVGLVQLLGMACAVVGLVLLAWYLALLWDDGFRVDRDWKVDIEKKGQVGDFIGGLVGSLFALSATFLFYSALTLQRREFRNSLNELRISNAALNATVEHHRCTLEVMRLEKDFNVCHVAAEGLLRDVDRLMFEKEIVGLKHRYNGIAAMREISLDWSESLFERKAWRAADMYENFNEPEPMLDIPPRYWEVSNLNERLFVLIKTIDSTAFPPLERSLLMSMAVHLKDQMHDALASNVGLARTILEGLEKEDDQALHGLRMSRDSVDTWNHLIGNIATMWSDANFPLIPT